MILLTTSHRPTRRVRTLCHDLVRCIPNLTRVNRGKMSLQEVAERSLELDAGKVIMVDRWKGGFGRLRFFNMRREGLIQIPPEIYIKNIKLQREFKGGERRLVRSLFIDESGGKDQEIKRLKESLSIFLEVLMMSIDEAPGRYQSAMRLQLDPSNLFLISFYKFPGVVEMGPRITVSHVVWEI